MESEEICQGPECPQMRPQLCQPSWLPLNWLHSLQSEGKDGGKKIKKLWRFPQGALTPNSEVTLHKNPSWGSMRERKCAGNVSFWSCPIQRKADAPRTASAPLPSINNALQQVLQARRASIYLNSQLLNFLKESLNYGWEQTMLSDGNISIKEQILFFSNTQAIVQQFLRKYWKTQIWIMKWSFITN